MAAKKATGGAVFGSVVDTKAQVERQQAKLKAEEAKQGAALLKIARTTGVLESNVTRDDLIQGFQFAMRLAARRAAPGNSTEETPSEPPRATGEAGEVSMRGSSESPAG